MLDVPLISLRRVSRVYLPKFLGSLSSVPFSAIYFPAYNHLKRDYFGEGPTKKLGILQLLTAGAIAGMPAAYLTTPCDVIKTRLQVEARKGETRYTSLRHCASTIYREEGFQAFFKGGPARVLRSSPQFAFTLAAYEVLQNLLPLHAADTDSQQHAQQQHLRPGLGAANTSFTMTGSYQPGVGLPSATAPLPFLRGRNALKIILDLDEDFGRLKASSSGDTTSPASATSTPPVSRGWFTSRPAAPATT